MPQQREIVNSPSFCTRAEKVTVGTQALKKKECRVSLADCICLKHMKGFHWIGRGKKRKTHSTLHMGRLSYREPPTRAVQRGPVSPAVQMTNRQASLSATRASQPAKTETGECDIDVTASEVR